jgi:hypothetical protein
METLLSRVRVPLDTDVYPEFAETSFREQLGAILDRIAPDLSVTLLDRPAYANASGCNGSVHVALLPGARTFRTEIRRAGITIGLIDCATIEEVAEIFATWLARPLNSKDAREIWPNANLREDADLYEIDDPVDRAWNAILYLNGGTPEPFLWECAKIPVIRGLMPFSSMDWLCFSRCTDYPFTEDCPVTFPMRDGHYQITLPDQGKTTVTGAAEAAEFVAWNLTPCTTRAFEGVADELNVY